MARTAATRRSCALPCDSSVALFVWEGENRKDLLEFYMPWALEQCPEPCGIDGVACVFEDEAGLFNPWTV